MWQPREQCDDDNALAGDGCDPSCRTEDICGNGVLDEALGEECDDFNTLDGDGCDRDCRLEAWRE